MELVEVAKEQCKALDPGVFESPNSEIQTQFSDLKFSSFPLNCEGFKRGGKVGAQGILQMSSEALYL